jgi:hypothetical protein
VGRCKVGAAGVIPLTGEQAGSGPKARA